MEGKKLLVSGSFKELQKLSSEKIKELLKSSNTRSSDSLLVAKRLEILARDPFTEEDYEEYLILSTVYKDSLDPSVSFKDDKKLSNSVIITNGSEITFFSPFDIEKISSLILNENNRHWVVECYTDKNEKIFLDPLKFENNLQDCGIFAIQLGLALEEEKKKTGSLTKERILEIEKESYADTSKNIDAIRLNLQNLQKQCCIEKQFKEDLAVSGNKDPELIKKAAKTVQQLKEGNEKIVKPNEENIKLPNSENKKDDSEVIKISSPENKKSNSEIINSVDSQFKDNEDYRKMFLFAFAENKVQASELCKGLGWSIPKGQKYLAEIVKYDDTEMEQYHDFIQFLCPAAKGDFNDNAPEVTDPKLISALSNIEGFKGKYLFGINRYLGYIGFKFDSNNSGWTLDKAKFKNIMAINGGHNQLRFSRMVLSLRGFNYVQMANDFLYKGSDEVHNIFWKQLRLNKDSITEQQKKLAKQEKEKLGTQNRLVY